MTRVRVASTTLGSALASLWLSMPAIAAPSEIDTSSHWTVDQQVFTADGKVSLTGLRKTVKLGNGALQSEACFGEITVPGIVIDGQERPFTRVIAQNNSTTSDLLEFNGTYEVLYGTPQQPLNVHLVIQLYRDGKFKTTATADSAVSHLVSVPVYLNYDFHGPNHDVFEFAWNKTSSLANGAGSPIDPTVSRSALSYATNASATSDTVDYFATVPNGVAATYLGLHQASNPDSIEYTALARIYDAHSGLGAVLWPWSESGASTTDYTLVFQNAKTGSRVVPVADATETLQATDSPMNKLPRYAYEGSDEAVTVVLKGKLGGTASVQMAGKLFQKSPGAHRLLLRVHYWDGLVPWVPDNQPQPAPFVFDPDHAATAFDGTTLSFRQAYQTLVADPSLVEIVVIKQNAFSPGDFNQALKLTRDFSAVSQEDVRRWQLDLFILPGNPSQEGIMPDIMGGGNKVEREGAQVSWDAIRADAQSHYASGFAANRWNVQWQIDRATVVAIHELGHELNFQHDWAQNNDIMTSHRDHIGDSINLNFGPNCNNWFRKMPETWVKPGRHGVMFGGDLLATGSIDPAFQPRASVPALGDVNFNGDVDIVDALLVAQAYVGLATPDEYYPEAADVNCSGSVDIVDALLIAQYYVNLIQPFTCQNP